MVCSLFACKSGNLAGGDKKCTQLWSNSCSHVQGGRVSSRGRFISSRGSAVYALEEPECFW